MHGATLTVLLQLCWLIHGSQCLLSRHCNRFIDICGSELALLGVLHHQQLLAVELLVAYIAHLVHGYAVFGHLLGGIHRQVQVLILAQITLCGQTLPYLVMQVMQGQFGLLTGQRVVADLIQLACTCCLFKHLFDSVHRMALQLVIALAGPVNGRPNQPALAYKRNFTSHLRKPTATGYTRYWNMGVLTHLIS